MDRYDNQEFAPEQEPFENPPQTQAEQYEYRGSGAGRKESPFANSPYQMEHEQNHYQPQYEAPQKPKKKKKNSAGKKILACVLSLAVVAGSCGITAALVNDYWDQRTEAMEKSFAQQIQSLQAQIDRASPAGTGNSVSGTAVANGGLTPGQVYAKNVHSVVLITSQVTGSVYGQATTGVSSGSGFILSEDGYVITNAHVVEGASSVEVTTYNGEVYAAQIQGTDTTNDVALLVFVPFTMGLLVQLGCGNSVIPVLVLQTVAANLGSMATPVGNPQNLYLYSFYNMSAGEFFAATAPATIASGVLIAALVLFIPKKSIPVACFADKVKLEKKSFALSLVLLAVSLATVFRLLDWQWMLAAVVVLLLVFDRGSLRDADFLLLLTFVCFFVFVASVKAYAPVSAWLEGLMAASPLLTSLLVSQVISNVPAAVVLSGFTDQWKQLLSGVNIGGLGTPIASLASLITIKFYMRWPGAKFIHFLGYFTIVNVISLAILLLFAQMI